MTPQEYEDDPDAYRPFVAIDQQRRVIAMRRRLAYAVYRFRVRRRLRRQGVDVALWESWQQAQRAGMLAMKPEDFVRGVRCGHRASDIEQGYSPPCETAPARTPSPDRTLTGRSDGSETPPNAPSRMSSNRRLDHE